MSNAIKFTPYSGFVNVHFKLIKNVRDLSFEDGTFEEIVKNSNNKYLEVQVEDTGIGIKEED